MAIVFDPIDKLIKITSGTSISALEIYNSVMDWCDEQENMGYTIPMKAVGKFPIGGGINTDSIFILINGWKIKLYDGNYQFIIIGTLITDDESARTVPPDSGNVEVVFQVSSQGTVVGDIKELQDQVTEVQGQTTNIEHVSEGRWEIKTEGGIDYLIQYERDNPDEIHKKYQLVKKDGIYVERIPV